MGKVGPTRPNLSLIFLSLFFTQSEGLAAKSQVYLRAEASPLLTAVVTCLCPSAGCFCHSLPPSFCMLPCLPSRPFPSQQPTWHLLSAKTPQHPLLQLLSFTGPSTLRMKVRTLSLAGLTLTSLPALLWEDIFTSAAFQSFKRMFPSLGVCLDLLSSGWNAPYPY